MALFSWVNERYVEYKPSENEKENIEILHLWGRSDRCDN